jgi:hypothetical protein
VEVILQVVALAAEAAVEDFHPVEEAVEAEVPQEAAEEREDNEKEVSDLLFYAI